MKTKKKAYFDKKVSDIIAPFKNAGLFTHLYMSCSRLYNPVYSYSVLPKGKKFFDLASLTKALVTSPLIFREAMSLSSGLETTIEEWLGEKSSCFSEEIRSFSLLSLLSHCSGLPAWRNLWVNRFQAEGDALLVSKCDLISRLNRESYQLNRPKLPIYSDLGFILLGLCLEIKNEKSLPEIFSSFCQSYLKTKDLEVFFPKQKANADTKYFIPTTFCPLRKRVLVAEVHDENSFILGGETGHAGVFSSGPGVEIYLKSLLLSDLGQFLVEENTKSLSLSSQTLVGWMPGNLSFLSNFFFPRCVGHLGFTGTSFWFDKETQSHGVLLLNRVWSKRQAPEVKELRGLLYTLMAEALRVDFG
ncbi:MAG: hypothetical protein CMP11_04135 [Zetaproteobacteria bacterium]|nr:hypothetical protein [Pseudobdellovibrionaceae bacterium]